MKITEKKTQEAIAELKEWIENPISIEDYSNYGINRINEKLQAVTIPKSIINGFESLNNWYSNNFVYEMLTKQVSRFKTVAVANGYYTILISDKLADQYMNQNPPSLAFDKFGYWLANCLSQKRYTESETLLKIINKGLNNNFINGGVNYKPATWFIIEIANKGYKNTLNYSKYNYPENMGVYQEALKNWNTNDLNLLDNIVSKLCDYHLKNASYGNQENDADIQFGDSAWFVYAFEILAWLSIREMLGLENPEKFSHPLMNLPLNKLQKEIIPMPKDDLFEKVMTRLNS